MKSPDLASRSKRGGSKRKEVVLWNMTVVANEVVLSKTVGGLSSTATRKAVPGLAPAVCSLSGRDLYRDALGITDPRDTGAARLSPESRALFVYRLRGF